MQLPLYHFWMNFKTKLTLNIQCGYLLIQNTDSKQFSIESLTWVCFGLCRKHFFCCHWGSCYSAKQACGL